MTILNYSHTLIPGANENVNDVQDMFEDAQSIINGGLSAENFTVATRPLTMLTHYQRLIEHSHFYLASQSTGTFIFKGCLTTETEAEPGAGLGAIDLNVLAATLSVSGLSPRLRLRTAIQVNSIASGFAATTFTVGLYPWTHNGSISLEIGVDLGTVVSGSTVTLTNPASSTVTIATGSDFELPADGSKYAPAFVVTGTPTAGTVGCITVIAEVHWI